MLSLRDLNLSLNELVEELLSPIPFKILKDNSNKIREKYRGEENLGEDFEIKSPLEAYTYSIYRMVQTSLVIGRCINEVLFFLKDPSLNEALRVDSVLDIGSGTGAAIIPLIKAFEGSKITLLEEQRAMVDVLEKVKEKFLAIEGGKNSIEIIHKSIENFKDGSYDIVLASYMANELDDGEISPFINKLKDLSSKYILLIVPGTPRAFKKTRRNKKGLNGGL